MSERTALHEQSAAAGAVFVEETGFAVPAHFGDVAAEYHHARTGAVVADLSHRGKVEARGADAARFLHNLSTNDVLRLAPGRGCEAFLTTNKAKVIAYLRIFRQDAPDGPSFWLDIAPGAAGKVLQHLDRFVISEQVEFTDHTGELGQIHLAGPNAPALVKEVLGCDPPAFNELVPAVVRPGAAVGPQVRRTDALGVPGFDLVGAGAAEWWRRLTGAGAQPIGRDACEILRVEAGLPREGADIDENTFAPEAGRIVEAICYTKGCYLGQEPIVMARDRGHVNRTLGGVRLPAGPVPPGSPLFERDKEVGRVTSSVPSPRLGTAVGLAYLRRGHQAPGTALEVEVADRRAPAEVAALPF
jgi:folate-binding protein YgfZ